MPVIQTITSASGTSAYVPTSRQLTINGVTYDLTADRSWTIEILDNLIATAPLSYNSTTNTISISQANNTTDGYLSSTDWLTFSSKQPAITLTTTGNNGASTLVGATLNVPEYTLAGLGGLPNPFSAALGQIIYSNSAGAPLSLSPNVTTTKKYLVSVGDGVNGDAPYWDTITASSIGAVPTTRTLTINGTSYDLSANRSWSVGTVTSVDISLPTGLSVSGNPITTSGTFAITFTAGYSIPTTAKQTEWDSAYTNRITNLTTTGNNGAATLIANTLNVPEYTLAGLGGLSNPFTGVLGQMIYSNAAGAPLNVAPNTTTTKKFLSMTGDGVSGDAPFWDTISPSSIGAVPTTRTLTINGTSYDLSADRSWTTITSLTGEATASGTGAVAVTLTNSAVIGKVLTGLNVTGGSVVATDTILQGFGKLQNQVNGLIGGVMYQGTWDASTNTPALTSSVGTKGYYYVVSVAGNTNLNGILDWNLGDWAIFNGSVWEKVDNTDSVISVNGFTGAVSLTTANISEVTNLYYTDTRARLAISETVTGLDYNSSTGVLSTTSGYAIPTTAKQTEWDSAYTNRITSLTTTGNSGAATLIANTLNVPEYTLAWLGGMSNPMTGANGVGDIIYGNASGAPVRRAPNVTTTKMFLSSTGDGTSGNAPVWEQILPSTIGAVPTTRTLTINGTAYDLSADRSWTVTAGVTSVGLSTTTSGVTIGSSPITSSGTITIDIDTASSTLNGLLSSTDWTTFNSKMNNPFTSLGDIVYSNAAGAPVRRAGNITTTKMFLSQTGDGTSSAAPQWSAITSADTGSVPTSRTLTINDVVYDLTANRSWDVGDFGTWQYIC